MAGSAWQFPPLENYAKSYAKIFPLALILPQMTGPDAVAAGRENAVRIDGVLQGLVQASQRMIVVGIDCRAIVHERRMRTILAPAMLRRNLDEPPEYLAGLAADRRIAHPRHSPQE